MKINIDIKWHINDTMLISIVYKKISDLLIKKDRKEIFKFIKSIKFGNNSLIIKTEKPIINSELRLMETELKKILLEIKPWLEKLKDDIKIILK